MASRLCRVSFIDGERVEHSVEVSAASLYGACVRALVEFRRAGFAEVAFGPTTRLSVTVKAPEIVHAVTVGKLQAWLETGGKTPGEQALKKTLRDALGERPAGNS